MVDYEKLSPESRVWIYQSNRPFIEEELNELRPALQRFAEGWVSHNQALLAWADVLQKRFIVLMVDESEAGASGCSIDKSVVFLKELENQYDIELFDRWLFAYELNGRVHARPREVFVKEYAAGEIDEETIVFDNLVKTKHEFDHHWKRPLKESWHARMV